jgi:protein-L-isoaspartate(D-aspartate) O-methyltransferase
MRWRRFWPRATGATRAGDPPSPPTHHDADDWAIQRQQMVHQQLERRGIHDPELLRAFLTVPRHQFVASDDPYGDHALAIGSGQTISQPYVVAAMTLAGQPEGGYRGARVLEVGTGSGYAAAILAELGASVVTVERHPSLAAGAAERLAAAGYGNVEVIEGDGSLGWERGAPYATILVTAGGPRIPDPLRLQLEDLGRLVMPVGTREQQWVTVLERHGAHFQQREVEPVVFVPLLGEHGFPE